VGAVFGGGRLARLYDWTTEWNIDAPLPEVYRVMSTHDEGEPWWPSMEVAAVAPIPGVPGGQIVTYHVKQASSVARFAPPFVITSVTADIEPERRWRSVVTGDLAGVLETLFYARPDGGTRIVYHWYVRVTQPLLNIAGFFAEPMFRASHDHVMREGEVGLNRYFREHAMAPAGARTEVAE
jgi:hypothetical protein